MTRRQRAGVSVVTVFFASAVLSNCDSRSTSVSTSVSTSTPATPSAPASTIAARGAAIRISEVMYHSPLDAPDDEFIELTNVGDQSAQLQGWCIDGVDYCFAAATTLDVDDFVVVTQSEMTGNLANDSDKLILIDPLGQTIDAIEYDDREPWPETADGGGASLHRIDFEGSGLEATSWVDAEPTPLAPYADSPIEPTGDVVITEVHYHPADDNPAAAFVELFNVSGSSIDLNGWCIAGSGHCFAAPTPIDAGATVVVAGTFTAESLSRSGDRLRLIDADGRVHDTVRYKDSGQWPALADGHGPSLHRRNRTLPGTLPGNWDAAPSTIAAVAPDAELLPMFDDVEFTVNPQPDSPISITGTVVDADEVSVEVVVGFGQSTFVPATLADDGVVTAEIPGQPAGSLVRFRLIATAGGTALGTWPRAGDGAGYLGTLVVDPAAEASELPRVQLFMPEDVYEEAYSTTTLQGNEGFPVVLVHDGEVFDNATIRVKGNQARTNRKRKWKVMLPAGYEWDAEGRISSPIDQFDLLPAATDKSYSREVLVSDMQELSGGFSQQVFPVRVELNGAFFGLYLYGESPDGGWRERQGLSDQTYVWKIEGVTKMRLSDLEVSSQEYRRKFEPITMLYRTDRDALLRDFITALANPNDEELIRYAFEHIDIPQVVEALATMRVVQHSEWQHKNHYVMYDPTDQRWRLVPIDFDLTFGRYYHSPCNALCDEITPQPYTEYMNGNYFARVLLDHEPFRSMVDRRTRTLAERYLAPGLVEARLGELLASMQPDAERDVRTWGQYGDDQTMAQAQQLLIDRFLGPRRSMYLDSTKYLPAAQPAEPNVTIDSIVRTDGVVIRARLLNGESVAVDVSLREFAEIGALLPAGVVIPASGAITVVFERAPAAAGGPLELQIVADRLEE